MEIYVALKFSTVNPIPSPEARVTREKSEWRSADEANVNNYDNPRPDQEVRRIEFLSTMTIAGPFLVGMALE
jgi:hypothetical protein